MNESSRWVAAVLHLDLRRVNNLSLQEETHSPVSSGHLDLRHCHSFPGGCPPCFWWSLWCAVVQCQFGRAVRPATAAGIPLGIAD